jgi:hypothetical protein
MAAADGQTLGGQSAETQAAFQAAYGSNASAAWEAEHNAAIGANQTQNAPSPGPGPSYTPQYGVNLDAERLKLEAANNAAQMAYYNAKLQNDADDLAFRKAQQAWTETYQRAGLTGTFEGQPTFPALTQYAQLFGRWGAPTTGQQTLAAQQQAWAQAIGAQQEARAAQALQQQTAQNYLGLLANLRGPADWAKYQQVLGATPRGMRDLVAAAMGQYIPGGGATTGVQPTPASLQTLQQQIAAGGGGGAGLTDFTNLPAPNQLAPQTWQALAPSQQQLLVGAYEAQGWNPNDVRALFEQSLPRYATNAPQTGAFRLL